jgi:hypothetical protein
MEFLDNFINSDVLTYTPETARKRSSHIFYDLVDYFKTDLTSGQYMNAYYFHFTVEKILSFSRNRQLKTAHLLYQKVLEMDKEFCPAIVDPGMRSFLLSCEGYLDYAQSDYDSALSKMNEAIERTLLQGDTMPRFIVSVYELQLNILRVHIKMQNTAAMAQLTTRLLNSLFFDENDLPQFSSEMSNLDEEERATWLGHILGNFIYSLNQNYVADPSEIRRILRRVLQAFFEAGVRQPDKNIHVYNALRILYAASQEDFTEFNVLLNRHFGSLKYCADNVKREILKNYLEMPEHLVPVLEEHANFDIFLSTIAPYNLPYKKQKQIAA